MEMCGFLLCHWATAVEIRVAMLEISWVSGVVWFAVDR